MNHFRRIRCHKEGRLVSIILDSPPLNILDREALTELREALSPYCQEDDTALVTLRAQGKAFSAGVSVEEHLPGKVEEVLPLFHRTLDTLASVKAPTMAVVQGPALGGGCELVALCDLVLASEKATFGQPEIKLGVFPPVAAALFPRLMGLKRALSLILGGEVIDAATAREIGLVTQVVSEERLEEEAQEWARRLLALSAPVLRLAKKAVYLGLPSFLSLVQPVEEFYLARLLTVEDATEGLKAFLEKRKPQWQQR